MLMVFFSSGTNSQLVIRTVFVSWVALRARAGVRMSERLCGCNWADSFSRGVIDVTNSIDVTDVTDKSRRNVFVPLTKKARRLICHFHSDELALPKVSGRLDGNSLLPHVLYLVHVLF